MQSTSTPASKPDTAAEEQLVSASCQHGPTCCMSLNDTNVILLWTFGEAIAAHADVYCLLRLLCTQGVC